MGKEKREGMGRLKVLNGILFDCITCSGWSRVGLPVGQRRGDSANEATAKGKRGQLSTPSSFYPVCLKPPQCISLSHKPPRPALFPLHRPESPPPPCAADHSSPPPRINHPQDGLVFSRSTGLALKACSLVLARSVSPPDSSRSDLSRDRWGLALTEVRARQQVSSFLGGTCVAAVVEFGPASSARRDGGLDSRAEVRNWFYPLGVGGLTPKKVGGPIFFSKRATRREFM